MNNKGFINGWQRNGKRLIHVDEVPVQYAIDADLFSPEAIFVVETVDWSTYAKSTNETIQRKKHIFLRFKDAVKFIASVIKYYPGYCSEDGEHFEDVVSFYPISIDEYSEFEKVHNYMMGVDKKTPFVSDEEALGIPEYDWIINPA